MRRGHSVSPVATKVGAHLQKLAGWKPQTRVLRVCNRKVLIHVQQGGAVLRPLQSDMRVLPGLFEAVHVLNIACRHALCLEEGRDSC